MDAANDLRCHLLIGPPGSGKTTLGHQLAPLLQGETGKPGLVLSTDAIREELFGDAAVQGPWDEAVIEEFHASLNNRFFKPDRAEGFATIVALNPAAGEGSTDADLCHRLAGLDGRIRNALNRQRAIEPHLHRYARLLDLVSQELWPGHLLVLESAWSSADAVSGFEFGEQLFEQLCLLSTAYREQKRKGAPDRIAGQAFGASYAARESSTIEASPQGKRERTFTYNGRNVVMWQHLKIGVKDSSNRTLRLHFHWDEELQQVVIGHCGRHLFNPNH